MPSLRDMCFSLLSETAGRFLDLQWSDGRWATVPEYETEEWNQFDQQYLLPAALLHVTERPDNPWQGSDRLLQAILRHGRYLEARIDENGAMQWIHGGVRLDHPYVCQRLIGAWLQAYQLLGSWLPAEDRTRWRETMTRSCEWLMQHHIVPHRQVTRFTSHDVGTGTNHFALYLSLLWRAGQEFGRPEWREASADLMHGLLADQRPGGYWEEHIGPALGYNYLTYHGVEEYTTWSGDQSGLEALRRGLDLHMHWTYPDGTAIECIDGRMRHLSAPMLWGLAGFTRWPEGRGYARLLLERLRAKQALPPGETMARIAMAYLYAHEGEEAAPPQLCARYRHVLEERSIVRKEGPWVVALSGHCCEPWTDNQFVLDRQALLSLWREGAGLVLDGSNSKFQPGLATFRGGEKDCQPRAARALYSGTVTELPLAPLPTARTAEQFGGCPRIESAETGQAEDAIEWQFDTFTATIRTRVLDAGHLEIRLSASGSAGITATLVPHVSYGETFTLESVGEVKLADAPFAYPPAQRGDWIAFRGIKLHLPDTATLAYPESPFNSYSANNTSNPAANRLVVRFPVGDEEAVVLVEAL